MDRSRLAAPLLLAALLVPLHAAAVGAPPQEEAAAPEIDWTEGPARVDVGAIAEVDLPESLMFTGERDTQKLLKMMGNLVDGSELGFITPKSDDETWFIVFEWADVGYVKDDEKDEIDADALLEQIKEGTEAGNEERKKMGVPPLHVVGWAEPPHYDAASHNLTWAVLAKNDEGGETVNYNVRVLGRRGVMSVTLVEAPAKLGASKPAVEQVLSAFSYKTGSKYAEWVPGDKVAEYGLTALVAAGAGAAAVKLGFFGFLAKLFAKMGKLVVVAVAAVGAAVVKLWNALRGRASARPAPRPGAGDPGASAPPQ